MNESFLNALSVLLRALNSAWSWFYDCWPAIAVTMLITLLVISIVIDRLINPMIGKATNDMIDNAMYGESRKSRARELRNSKDNRVKSAKNLIRQERNRK